MILAFKRTMISIVIIFSAAASSQEVLTTNAIFNDAFIAYGNKVEECTNHVKTNTVPFPTTSWFSSLTNEMQKRVVLYMSLSNRMNCSEAARLKATDKAQQLSSQEQSKVEFFLEATDLSQYSEGLDLDRVKELQAIYSLPFNSFTVARDLGLWTE
ncbi:hypothetical protein N9R79_12150 [Vibrio sp.]|nr:hypothetical protein [Vibrio sp.]